MNQPVENKAVRELREMTRYQWSCECGGHSRSDGFVFPADAEYAAQRHQWNNGVHHPMPTVTAKETP
jgi:hypothetical protein